MSATEKLAVRLRSSVISGSVMRVKARLKEGLDPNIV